MIISQLFFCFEIDKKSTIELTKNSMFRYGSKLIIIILENLRKQKKKTNLSVFYKVNQDEKFFSQLGLIVMACVL